MKSPLGERILAFCKELLGQTDDDTPPPLALSTERYYRQNNMALHVYDAAQGLLAELGSAEPRTDAEIEYDFQRIVRFYRSQKMPPTWATPIGSTYRRAYDSAYYGSK